MFNVSIQDFIKKTFIKDEYGIFENLLISKRTEKKPHMVILKGMAGIGKTWMLKILMLAWSKGLVFQNIFSYIFYFCCQDVKQLKTVNLPELISSEWPSPSVPIEDILSQPEKLLFVIDSLEGMECDLSKQDSDNCMEKRSVSILISSLLRKKMLSESSFPVSATPEIFEKIEDRIQCTDVKTETVLNERRIKIYFHRLFQDMNKVQEAFSLMRENEQLFTICQVPLLCWMVATCLKEEGKRPSLHLLMYYLPVYHSYFQFVHSPKCPISKQEKPRPAAGIVFSSC